MWADGLSGKAGLEDRTPALLSPHQVRGSPELDLNE